MIACCYRMPQEVVTESKVEEVDPVVTRGLAHEFAYNYSCSFSRISVEKQSFLIMSSNPVI
jgi:hypothetical protein